MFLKRFRLWINPICISLCAVCFAIEIYLAIHFLVGPPGFDEANLSRSNLPHQIHVSREAIERASRAAHECHACYLIEESYTLLLVLSRPNSTLHRARLRASLNGSRHQLVFVLSMDQNDTDEHVLRKESEQYKDIVPGNFSLEQDTTLGVSFAFSLVIHFFNQSVYAMVMQEQTVLNVQPLDELFDCVEQFDDGSTIFGYIVNEVDRMAFPTFGRSFRFLTYLAPGAVIYPTKLISDLFKGGMKFSGRVVTKDSFFPGLVAKKIGIKLKHIDNFDAFCNLPTVCKSAPVLMNCFDLNGQCGKDEIY